MDLNHELSDSIPPTSGSFRLTKPQDLGTYPGFTPSISCRLHFSFLLNLAFLLTETLFLFPLGASINNLEKHPSRLEITPRNVLFLFSSEDHCLIFPV